MLPSFQLLGQNYFKERWPVPADKNLQTTQHSLPAECQHTRHLQHRYAGLLDCVKGPYNTRARRLVLADPDILGEASFDTNAAAI